MSEQVETTEASRRSLVGHETKRAEVVDVLNAALAAEVSALGRCKRSYYLTDDTDLHVRQEFLDHVVTESMNADRIVARILELGGLPRFDSTEDIEVRGPDAGIDTRDLVLAEVAAQQLSIATYQGLLDAVAPSDLATRSVLEDIVRRDASFLERLERHL